jgi:hypothetical protein
MERETQPDLPNVNGADFSQREGEAEPSRRWCSKVSNFSLAMRCPIHKHSVATLLRFCHLRPFQVIVQGFDMTKRGMQAAAKGTQHVAKETAKFVAKPVVYAAKTTAKVAKMAGQKVAEQVHKAENRYEELKR